jgi:hypothetical protein
MFDRIDGPGPTQPDRPMSRPPSGLGGGSRRWLGLIVLVLSSFGAAGAFPGLQLEFRDPDRYADIGRQPSDRERALVQVRAVFESLARPRLRAGQVLEIEVLNVDLAGHVQPSQRSPGSDIRVRRVDSDQALIAFRWTLRTDGRVVDAGEERIVDDDAPGWARHGSEVPLDIERRMLERWFDQRIGKPAGAGPAPR